MFAGSCLCGAVRYQLAQVRDAGLCHCPTCRRAGGSAFAAWAEAPAGALAVVQGAPRTFRLDEDGGEERSFCGDCGTPLWHDRAGVRRVHIGTLDDPAAVAPRIHLAAHQQVPWLRLADVLPWTEALEPTPPDSRVVRQGPADPSVGRDSPLSLRPIAIKDQLRAVLRLDVNGHQRRMVSPNAHSLAELALAPRAWARSINAGDVAVGFVMVDVLGEDHEGLPMTGDPYVWRFLIDHRYQGLGLGARALELVAETARADSARALWLSCEPAPSGPYHFYRRLGFEDTGRFDEDEIILKRAYPR